MNAQPAVIRSLTTPQKLEPLPPITGATLEPVHAPNSECRTVRTVSPKAFFGNVASTTAPTAALAGLLTRKQWKTPKQSQAVAPTSSVRRWQMPKPDLDDQCMRCGHRYGKHSSGMDGPCRDCEACPRFFVVIDPNTEICVCGHTLGFHKHDATYCMAADVGSSQIPCLGGECFMFQGTCRYQPISQAQDQSKQIDRCKCGHKFDLHTGNELECGELNQREFNQGLQACPCQKFRSEVLTNEVRLRP